ncbi:MAG: hypothetical protein AAF108_03790 [Planctomycetota bacterium]
MGRKRQLVVFRARDEDRPVSEDTGDPAMPEPLGQPREVLGVLSRFNTAPDGGRSLGADGGPSVASATTTLHGPGLIAEFPGGPDGRDPISQVMVTVIEEDMAWPVLSRLCRETGWRLQDVDSGLTFGG